MGIYISDLEIPKDKAVQIVIIRDDGVCVDECGNTYGVVSLPRHGRLIDADALTKMCQEMQSIEWNNKAAPYSWAYAYESFESDIDNAPTIIPAEPCNDLSKPNNDGVETWNFCPHCGAEMESE